MDVLLSVDNNLASSIALRYMCRQARVIPMTIQPIHVQYPVQKHYPLGSGWVRHTWEDCITMLSADEINAFVYSEAERCEGLIKPKVVLGDKTDEVLKELDAGFYDLYVEGMLLRYEVNRFYSLLKDRLFKKIQCPILIVKNLVQFNSVVLLVNDDIDVEYMMSFYLKLYAEADIPVFVVYYSAKSYEEAILREVDQCPSCLGKARDLLSAGGRSPDKLMIAEGRPEGIAEKLKGSGLVISTFRRDKGVRNSLIDIVAQTTSPILLFWN